MRCPQCSGEVEAAFRFCPWCAGPLRLKLVEFFRPHVGIGADEGKALRVSRYLAPDERHVRFSVWREHGADAEAEAAVSLDEEEACRLARFLAGSERPERAPTTLERLLDYVRR